MLILVVIICRRTLQDYLELHPSSETIEKNVVSAEMTLCIMTTR